MSDIRELAPFIVERGNVFFLLRPRTLQALASAAEQQRFVMLLEPELGGVSRRLVLGIRRIPELGGHECLSAIIDSTAETASDLTRDLGAEVALAATRPRSAGEGFYVLVEHGGHTHLAYTLELAPTPEAQERQLRVELEASFIVAVRRPPAQPPRLYSAELQAIFGAERFAFTRLPRLLDVAGCELVLIGPEPEEARRLGMELRPERELEAMIELREQLSLAREDPAALV